MFEGKVVFMNENEGNCRKDCVYILVLVEVLVMFWDSMMLFEAGASVFPTGVLTVAHGLDLNATVPSIGTFHVLDKCKQSSTLGQHELMMSTQCTYEVEMGQDLAIVKSL